MADASTITTTDFKDALGRYPALIKELTKPPKPDSLTLEQLDQFRYIDAPAAFSKGTGRSMKLEDVQKLVEWKLQHGKFRPSLPKLVASNSDEKIDEATKDAFSHYASNPGDIANTIQKLAEPLRGIGPATASLLLAVHDPKNVIFFSDEAFRWLCANGGKASIKYSVQEFEQLFTETKALMSRLDVSPIEIEQAAYVIIKEHEPVDEPKPKKEPSGRPRGRPAKPDSEKKPKKVPVPGRGRGRPRKDATEDAPKAKKVETAPKANTVESAPGEKKKKRGRPRKVVVEAEEEDGEHEDDDIETTSPADNKRKAAEETAGSERRGGKKAKA